MSEFVPAAVAGIQLINTTMGLIQSGIAAAEKEKDQTAQLKIYRDTLVSIGDHMRDAMLAESNHREPEGGT